MDAEQWVKYHSEWREKIISSFTSINEIENFELFKKVLPYCKSPQRELYYSIINLNYNGSRLICELYDERFSLNLIKEHGEQARHSSNGSCIR